MWKIEKSAKNLKSCLAAALVGSAILIGSGCGEALADDGVVLRNVEYMPRTATSRPPSRPRKFLRRRNLQVQVERDAKYLQLLLASVGFVGMFILILVLRSMPPAKKAL